MIWVTDKSNARQQGSVLLFTLVLVIAFVVITAVWAQFAALQQHSVTRQEQQGRAFYAADSGVQRVLFELNGRGRTIAQVRSGGPIIDVILDDEGNVQGRYEVQMGGAGQILQLSVTGRDAFNDDECQLVTAVITSFTKDDGELGYYLRDNDHEAGTSCDF